MTTEVRYLAHHLLHAGVAPLRGRDRRLALRLARRMHASRDPSLPHATAPGLGQRLADRVAAIGGSWSFIVGFCVFLACWAGLNALVLSERAFDPYPFVFLNLVLSMVAALQAPVILMSQNRQAAQDRIAAALAHEVSLKAEARISDLHVKVDRLLARLGDASDTPREAANDEDEPRPGLRAVG